MRDTVRYQKVTGPTGQTTIKLLHDCEVVGCTVEISDDWNLCPWCGRGLIRAIAKARNSLQ